MASERTTNNDTLFFCSVLPCSSAVTMNSACPQLSSNFRCVKVSALSANRLSKLQTPSVISRSVIKNTGKRVSDPLITPKTHKNSVLFLIIIPDCIMKDSVATNEMKVDDDADESSENSTGDEGSALTPNNTEPRRSAKRRIIDETLLDEDEARKLESRRAYNRKCAAKARKRSKDLISQLQEEVQQLNQDKAKLERTNEVMQAQLKILEQQNQSLVMNQRQSSGFLVPGMPSGARAGLMGDLPRAGFLGGLPQASADLTALTLLDTLSQRDRAIASQILSNDLLLPQFQNSQGSRMSRGFDPSKRLP